jgi:hypothetical protein
MRTVPRKTDLIPPDSDSDQDNTEWTDNTQSQCGTPVINRFIENPSGICQNKAPTINKDLTLPP